MPLLRASFLLILLLTGFHTGYAADKLEDQIKDSIDASSGSAKRRFIAWQKLLKSNKNIPTRKKLEKVNRFFNLFKYQPDTDYKGVADYWKTPQEFVQNGGGDCEDFSIAKYFTLMGLAVPMKRLRITYVKHIKRNQAHMVLAYYPEPDSDPLILDNLNPYVLPASKRNDLVPVYSFNTEDLWLASPMGDDRYLGRNTLKKWQAVMSRIQKKESAQ